MLSATEKADVRGLCLHMKSIADLDRNECFKSTMDAMIGKLEEPLEALQQHFSGVVCELKLTCDGQATLLKHDVKLHNLAGLIGVPFESYKPRRAAAPDRSGVAKGSKKTPPEGTAAEGLPRIELLVEFHTLASLLYVAPRDFLASHASGLSRLTAALTSEVDFPAGTIIDGEKIRGIVGDAALVRLVSTECLTFESESLRRWRVAQEQQLGTMASDALFVLGRGALGRMSSILGETHAVCTKASALLTRVDELLAQLPEHITSVGTGKPLREALLLVDEYLAASIPAALQARLQAAHQQLSLDSPLSRCLTAGGAFFPNDNTHWRHFCYLMRVRSILSETRDVGAEIADAVSTSQQARQAFAAPYVEASLARELFCSRCTRERSDFSDLAEAVRLRFQRHPVKLAKSVLSFPLFTPVQPAPGDSAPYSFYIDPLFEQFGITVRRPDAAPFPNHWRLDDEGAVDVTFALKEAAARKSQDVTSLDEFLREVAVRYPEHDWGAVQQLLEDQSIISFESLASLKESDWSAIRQSKIGAVQRLFNEVSVAVSNARQRLLDVAAVHCARRRIGYFCLEQRSLNPTSELATLPWLCEEAVSQAVMLTKIRYHGEQLVDRMHNEFFLCFTKPRTAHNTAVMALDRGMLLFGPPGTGKSDLSSRLPEMAGIVMVGPPMSSGELARSYKGESEKLIKDYCERAARAPWLLFGWVVDETDALAPKRTTGGSGEDGNASKLAAFLSVVGGSADVPNIMVIGGTNRLEAMDEAVLRRLSGQFYVGKPSFQCRKTFFGDALARALRDHGVEPLTPAEADLVVHMSMNFSGAALRKLVMRLLIALTRAAPASPPEVPPRRSKQWFAAIVQSVALTMKVAISGVSIPGVVASGGTFTTALLRAQLHSRPWLSKCTRRVFVDCRNLSEAALQFEYRDEQLIKNRSIPLRPRCKHDGCGLIAAPSGQCKRAADCSWYASLDNSVVRSFPHDSATALPPMDVKFVPHILGELVLFADAVEAAFIVMADRAFLQDKSCFSEDKALDELQSVFRERKLCNSLVVIDLDELANVNLSQSTGMAGSLSYSVSQPNVLNAVLAEFSRGGAATDDDQWIVAFSRNDVVIKMFEDAAHWVPTREAAAQRKLDGEEQNCTACGQIYKESENKPEACKYHPGSLGALRPEPLADGTHPFQPVPGPLEAGYSYDPATLGLDDACNEDDSSDSGDRTDQAKLVFFYSCCGAKAGSGGCHSAKHRRTEFRRVMMHGYAKTAENIEELRIEGLLPDRGAVTLQHDDIRAIRRLDKSNSNGLIDPSRIMFDTSGHPLPTTMGCVHKDTVEWIVAMAKARSTSDTAPMNPHDAPRRLHRELRVLRLDGAFPSVPYPPILFVDNNNKSSTVEMRGHPLNKHTATLEDPQDTEWAVGLAVTSITSSACELHVHIDDASGPDAALARKLPATYALERNGNVVRLLDSNKGEALIGVWELQAASAPSRCVVSFSGFNVRLTVSTVVRAVQ